MQCNVMQKKNKIMQFQPKEEYLNSSSSKLGQIHFTIYSGFSFFFILSSTFNWLLCYTKMVNLLLRKRFIAIKRFVRKSTSIKNVQSKPMVSLQQDNKEPTTLSAAAQLSINSIIMMKFAYKIFFFCFLKF